MEIDKKVPDHFKIETISAPHIPSSRIVDCQCKIKYLLSLEDWFGLDKKSEDDIFACENNLSTLDIYNNFSLPIIHQSIHFPSTHSFINN
ncbi:hypothetical protein YC2023_064685 [Brassica napus]